MMKDDFLPIPGAPNYEVNGNFIVRNAITKHAIQPLKSGEIACYYGGKRFQRRPESYYRVACAALDDNFWSTVPSLDNKYELNFAGDLRNSNTKILLKKYPFYGTFAYIVCLDGTYKKIAADLLKSEVYGTEIKPLLRCKHQIRVLLTKDGERHAFESIAACAKFLAPRVFYTAGTVCRYMQKRPAELWGWSVRYFKADEPFP